MKIINNYIPPLKYLTHQIKGSTELKGTTTEIKYIQIWIIITPCIECYMVENSLDTYKRTLHYGSCETSWLQSDPIANEHTEIISKYNESSYFKQRRNTLEVKDKNLFKRRNHTIRPLTYSTIPVYTFIKDDLTKI